MVSPTSRVSLALLLAATATACGSVNSSPDASSTADATAAVDGAMQDTNPQACTPDTSVCAADVTTVCDSAGEVASVTDCTLGCFDAERCAKLDPSNGLASHLDVAATANDVVFSGAFSIDTDNPPAEDEMGNAMSTAVDTSGPIDILVIRAKSFTAGNMGVVGSRALAIVSDGDISINGMLNVSAQRNQSGAGAPPPNAMCLGGDGAGTGDIWSGGGGGGFGGSGGGGGNAGSYSGGTGLGVNGGPALTPLRGGCRGGNGGGNDYNGMSNSADTDPGAGGGAVQLVSNTAITLGATGMVLANGGGGKAWTGGTVFCVDGSACFPGEGGGSGGGVLLEAPVISVPLDAVLAANGGGGSCGAVRPGQNGQNGDSRAAGGNCTGLPNHGNGGAGGAGPVLGGSAGGASPFAIGDAHGGGGGGGVGRIRVNLPMGSTFAPEGIVSPAASEGVLGLR